jgi:ribosomal protein L11 methyltransferase
MADRVKHRRWTELSIEAPGEYAEPIVHLFSKHLDGAVVVESPGGYNPDEGEAPPVGGNVIVRGYTPAGPTTQSRTAMIDVGLRLISYLAPLPELQVREMDESEWRDQSFEPIRVGKRLVITPPGSEAMLGPDDLAIPLEPGLAFGTGHHPTTAMVLAALERMLQPGAEVLDVGSGSGILSIAALKLGAGHVVAVDIEDDSFRSTMHNLERAQLADRADVILGTLPDERVPAGSFDVVLANISANVLKTLAGRLLGALSPDGVLIASGVLEERRQEVEEAFIREGGAITGVEITGDWVSFTVKRL